MTSKMQPFQKVILSSDGTARMHFIMLSNEFLQTDLLMGKLRTPQKMMAAIQTGKLHNTVDFSSMRVLFLDENYYYHIKNYDFLFGVCSLQFWQF